MKEQLCPYESMLTRAISTGEWSNELRDHVSSCTRCKETEYISKFMNSAAASFAADNPVPDAGQILFTSHLIEQQELKRKAMLPVLLAQITVASTLAAMALIPIFRSWSHIASLLVEGVDWLQNSFVRPSIDGPLGLLTSPAFGLMLVLALILFLRPQLRRRIGI
jgi:hypothetical protein